MPVIAITGGLGSGKSTVREIFEGLGAACVDTDVLARKIVEPGSEGAQRIRDAFGEHFFDRDGRLDRKRMASVVFKDKSALTRLEKILHPLIRQEEARLADRYLEEDPARIVVVEIPLLVEKGRACDYDGVVLVKAPEKTRLDRLRTSGRLDDKDALARMEVQISDQEREAVACWTVDNSGTLQETEKQVEKIYSELKQKGPNFCPGQFGCNKGLDNNRS